MQNETVKDVVAILQRDGVKVEDSRRLFSEIRAAMGWPELMSHVTYQKESFVVADGWTDRPFNQRML